MPIRSSVPDIRGFTLVRPVPRGRPALSRGWLLRASDGTTYLASQISTVDRLLAHHVRAAPAQGAGGRSTYSRVSSSNDASIWGLMAVDADATTRPGGRRTWSQVGVLAVALVASVLISVHVGGAATKNASGALTASQRNTDSMPSGLPSTNGDVMAGTACIPSIDFGGVAVLVPPRGDHRPFERVSLAPQNKKWVPACADTH